MRAFLQYIKPVFICTLVVLTGCGQLSFSGDDVHAAFDCALCHTINDTGDVDRTVLPPGDLKNAATACGRCHFDQHARVKSSLMTTNRGLVTKNRAGFGESGHQNPGHITDLDYTHSAADSYASQLCASCHLGRAKSTWGPWQGYNKGGGCLGCHLEHKAGVEQPWYSFLTADQHPQIKKTPSSKNCFNCHSRSGRISLNYYGLSEVDPVTVEELGLDHQQLVTVTSAETPAANPSALYFKLTDGRTLKRQPADVHSRAGMQCADCHTSLELMGDGQTHLYQQSALKVTCRDCHDRSTGSSRLPAGLQGNVYRQKAGALNAECSRKEHDRLTCDACHSTWAPSCVSCHISYNPDENGYNHLTGQSSAGRWEESAGGFMAVLPVLGRVNNKVTTFVQGMKMTVDTRSFYSRLEQAGTFSAHAKQAAAMRYTDGLFYRNLFSPASAHTTGRARNCTSCHWSAQAAGWGDGRLTVQAGRLKTALAKGLKEEDVPDLVGFNNSYSLEPFGDYGLLPQDGWIRPFQNAGQSPGTLPYSLLPQNRPLSAQMQKKLLRVGLCLQCHDSEQATVYRRFGQAVNYIHKNK